MRYEIDIFHYLEIYKKEWKKIVLLASAAALISAAIGYMQPVIYRSTVTALSSKGSGQTINVGGILGLPNISVGNSSDDTIFSMLKSRRMGEDINKHFNLAAKPKFWWALDTYIVTGGFAIEVKGPDPELTRDIANFAVENVDKINSELQISPGKPMIKVLDSAATGVPTEKNISKKIIAHGLIIFLIYSLFIFFKEYFSKIRIEKRS